MESDKFKEYYGKLNAEQKRAVDLIDGPVMVVAGPGTGKTQILTLRIANILLKTDTDPDSILAITFTESGVHSMRKRLAEIVGALGYRVAIKTFHGFTNDIIKNYPEEFPHIIGAQNITEVEQIGIIEKIVVEDDSLNYLRPINNKNYFVKEIISNISTLKREGLNGEDFLKLAKEEKKKFERIDDLYHEKGAYKGKMKGEYKDLEKNIQKNLEFAKVYSEYEKELRSNNLYDYGDMILEVLKVLEKNKDLLLTLQEQYQYFLVDEHQDTNQAQNKIMELLCNFYDNPNIFIVGDEKQAIYRFQGASLNNFLYFKNLYPKAQVVYLESNYRSTQTVLNAAHDLIPSPKGLKSQSKIKEKPISVVSLETDEEELLFLADSIEEKIKSGVKPEDIAVLYRDNKDASALSDVLEKKGIPFNIESDENVLADNEIRKLITLIRCADSLNEELLAKVVQFDFIGLNSLDVWKLFAARRKNYKTPLGVLISRAEFVSESGVEDIQAIKDFLAKMSDLHAATRNLTLPEFFEKVVKKSGFLAHILSLKNSAEKLQKLNSLFSEIKDLFAAHKNYSISDFLEYLDSLDRNSISIKPKKTGNFGNVHLMTAHRSKGQEFKIVYIIQAIDGHWGSRRSLAKIQLINSALSLEDGHADVDDGDERRLFYVALTRAKEEVVVTCSRKNKDNRDNLKTKFLENIRKELIEEVDVPAGQTSPAQKADINFRERIISGPEVKSSEFIKETFLDKGLSVSALNNYLSCPWRYFYSSLLNIPMAQETYLLYGTAVHDALKHFFDKLREGESPDKEYLISKFKEVIQKMPLNETDLADFVKRGEASLGGYYDFYSGKFHTNSLTEYPISRVYLDEIPLTGKLDKIEILDNSGLVNVVDYKTGKPKSRGEIEGETKTSEGNIKRQLVFYKLLLSLFADGNKFRFASADIDFVEPMDSGKYKKEHFTVSDEEVEELKSEIRRVADEIINFKFWDKRCGDKHCEFCELREMVK